MRFDEKLHDMTTLIHTQTAHGKICEGTGFFYTATEQGDHQWERITGQWVVTNRHVVMPIHNEVEERPLSITFYLRRWDRLGRIKWVPFAISSDDFDRRVKLHPNQAVDVALIDILDLYKQKVYPVIDNYTLAAPFHLSQNRLARQNAEIQIGVGSEVLVVGYPRGFYDDLNLFPIVKSGIVASKWGTYFQGNPFFLIDSKLFPGSSGSLVISRPIDSIVRDRKILTLRNDEKAFVLLGVYSGEYQEQTRPVEVGDLTITQTVSLDLGIVWYADVIEEIISNSENDHQAM